MPIEYHENQAVFRDVVTVEDAFDLLQCLRHRPATTVDLGACTHLHAVNLQVLMATPSRIAVWPTDLNLRVWLEDALGCESPPA